MSIRAFIVVLALGVSLATAPARAEDPKSIGVFTDWEAVTFTEGGNLGCYMTSDAKKSVGNYKERGKVYALVTHRPANESLDVVTLIAGYTFKKDSDVVVDIAGQKFSLFTDKNSAWARDAETDHRLVAAMRKGSTMTVKGSSERGTATTDTYSLKGFSKAYAAINAACGVNP